MLQQARALTWVAEKQRVRAGCFKWLLTAAAEVGQQVNGRAGPAGRPARERGGTEEEEEGERYAKVGQTWWSCSSSSSSSRRGLTEVFESLFEPLFHLVLPCEM